MRFISGTALCICSLGIQLQTTSLAADDWKDKTISPVTNPLFFEDPNITSEVRPIFLYHRIDDDFVTGGGNVRVYAIQARYALTERLALIATKDGYVEFNPRNNAIPKADGWADIGAGLKYALIDDRENDFILTPGFKLELPTGNQRVFQGNGKGEWDLFVSAMKGWNNLHVTGGGGVRLPNDWDAETSSAHYSLQVDYYTCQYFIPFAAVNGFTVLSEAEEIPLTVEGYDLINFGSSEAGGFTQVTGGVGFRSRILQNLDVGFAYETSLSKPRGLFDDRYTVDVIWRF
jgi:hypothetical protein